MAQTISLVRGTATIATANGTNVVTLFTNSASGIATRVIVNQLTVTSSSLSTTATGTSLSLFNSGSGTAESIIGGAYSYQSQNRLTVTPSQSLSGFGGASASGTLAVGGTLAGGRDFFQQPTTSGNNYNICPTNFWIGPSDIIRAKSQWYATSGKSNVPQSVTIAYSFTLITES
jgi:hypothetical protein